ncbi:helix-turn-helix transcriptional regulator [Tianweitania sp. BSSL-BM11]|uniref:Helix-turn-helix transcriptional regulator n=1 Tax=Tianweitania aestuarii TaxID=2814886 RepID=A0ABS5RYC5_9HYPH|nr:LuxR C-terminal-related transcriptional regulator [Tianweitania aestuarii]MBS9721321.1 helix-turn-helix transcriptional regulator [Tianweitania aestuarii]
MFLGSFQSGTRFSIATPAATAAYMPLLAELLELSEDLGASDFSLLSVTSGRTGKLSPLMDSAYPDAAALSQQLVSEAPATLVRHPMSSTIISWWAASDHPAATQFERLRWATRTTPLGTSRAGLVMPLHARCAEYGVLVLTGSEFQVDDDRLANAHLQALDLFGRLIALRVKDADNQPKLSGRELDCLRLTAEGQTSEEIAAGLGLSIHTANTYLGNATQKLDAVNRMHAVAKALRLGLID